MKEQAIEVVPCPFNNFHAEPNVAVSVDGELHIQWLPSGGHRVWCGTETEAENIVKAYKSGEIVKLGTEANAKADSLRAAQENCMFCGKTLGEHGMTNSNCPMFSTRAAHSKQSEPDVIEQLLDACVGHPEAKIAVRRGDYIVGETPDNYDPTQKPCGHLTVNHDCRVCDVWEKSLPAVEPVGQAAPKMPRCKGKCGDAECEQLAAAAQPEPQGAENIREKLFQFREWFINDTRESLKDGLLHLNDLDRLEEKFDELERAVLPRIVKDGKEFLRFERDPNNGANLHAVFFGDRALHHFRADQNVTQYMADIQRNLDEYLRLAAHNGEAK